MLLPVSAVKRVLVLAPVLLVLLAGRGVARGQEALLVNPDFEQGRVGETPVGWLVPKMPADQGFTTVLTAEQPQSGRLCVEIRWPAEGTSKAPFANLLQSVDAAPWRGKRIKVTAAVRVAAGGDGRQAQMWLRVDRPGGMGAFDNMSNRPITAATWADYSIIADVAEDAQKVVLGLMARGGATPWWDNVRVEVSNLPVRASLEANLKNLVAFARLAGYVRHYHPSDAAASTDWLPFLAAAPPKVEKAPDAAALAAALQAAFAPIAARRPRLTSNRVFLTDGSTISYGETLMAIVEAYKLGEIMGETAAGTKRNVCVVNLPLGYRMGFTGMQVLKHDRSRHHGVGIAPTVPVARTIQGIRAGRDEQLERALALLH